MDLFNKRILKQRLEHFTFPSGNKQKDIIRIIKGWQIALTERDLEKTKEKSIQGEFLIKFFESILGYSTHSSGKTEWNLISSPKTEVDAQEADGSIGFFTTDNKITKAVIELKDASTSLEKKQTGREKGYTPIEQGYLYASKFDWCKWIIISNFKEIRLYHKDRTQDFYEIFDVLKLDEEDEFKRFYYILCKDNLISKTEESVIENLSKETNVQEENITKEFYKKYKETRSKLFNHLVKNNPDIDKNIILVKTQKIIDRVIFVSFCEDLGLLPPNIFRKILDSVKSSFALSENKIWNQVKGLFHSINVGNPPMNVNKFNGGLFSIDPILDTLNINDESLKELIKISDYDFESDLNVNILGHIFEQSISDIEEMKLEISDDFKEIKKGKRKKEGIYYTPEYITKYIVDKTVGGWLQNRKEGIGFKRLPELSEKDYKSIKITKGKLKANTKVKAHIKFWESYRKILQNIKVLDPACGSGAFLIQAFDYLYKEGQLVNDELGKLKKGQRQIFDLDKHILTNNIYGVDLNEESVEITKLSLWLKTANKNKELTELDDNIKCGNSLVDDPHISGEKTFKWSYQFNNIISDGGFDVIIGNPPYGASLTKEEKDYFRKKYDDVHLRTPDTFNYFISLSTKLLKSNGFLSFIVPNNLFFQHEFTKTRNLLINSMQLVSVMNLGDKVFADSEVPTGIFIVSKRVLQEYEFEYTDLRSLEIKDELILSSARKTSYKKSEVANNNSLTLGIDRFINTINKKIMKNSSPIDDIASDVSYGISTGGNKIFCVKKDYVNKFNLEKPLLFKILYGEDIDRYSIKYKSYNIIYSVKSVKINDFPKIYDYLKTFKNTLLDRSEVEAGILPWWCLNRPRSESLFEGEKIILRQTGDSIKACTDYNNYFVLDSVMIVKLKKESNINLKYLLAILNSKLINYIYKNISQENRRSFAQVKPINIRKLPIKNADNDQQLILINKIDKIFSLKITILDAINKEVNFLISELELKDAILNLEDFYKLSWNSFIKEIEEYGTKININKKQELFNYYTDKQKKIKYLENEIDKIDGEIDQEVYKLYELTEDEIKKIEQLFKKNV